MLIEPIIFDSDVDIKCMLFKMQMKSIRENKHITQLNASDLSGISTKCIRGIESIEQGNPKLKTVIRYLNYMGYELDIKRKETQYKR